MDYPIDLICQTSGLLWELSSHSKENKPKMAYSRDLPKMAGQQCGIMD